ncbi:zip metal ion transporter [Grosmannia clavigera kw1407]|uniref:Zip metal ion transporter n=1 Tax=Grosmannia clavigera (strain kw1407 / UAMH 11150) TaxID=655863 RepID=F0XQ93_GROCL|nr:zip metal ion transporter [Grosmannia clavigera kw1407]EFX00244.1 zip metal ion transporter [Grosmannia clavigera kw1407]
MVFVVRAVPDDRRGWILCVVSAIACIFGACFICVDVFVRLLPGQKDFRIEDSNAFLASSLSLSFGVMIFSALFSMLPSSKRYLIADGVPKQRAGLLMMAAFVVGFVGIQVVSRIIHRFMPSHVVDCDHSHEDDGADENGHDHSHKKGHKNGHPSSLRRSSGHTGADGGSDMTESTPLLLAASNGHVTSSSDEFPATLSLSRQHSQPLPRPAAIRRQSMKEVVRDRLVSFVKDTKTNCDEFGPCYGYSDPCGQECKTHLATRVPAPLREVTSSLHRTPWSLSSENVTVLPVSIEERSSIEDAGSSSGMAGPAELSTGTDTASIAGSKDGADESRQDASSQQAPPDADTDLEAAAAPPHHHHVPTNAFLSIGVQTVLAIGLHKFPEGFIMFATNHANPALGLNVFLALLVHNVAEGFAMALPLYMALGSRLRAIAWASALGGLSQPLGAGVAAIWLWYLGRGDSDNDKNSQGTAYGLLFGVTAGIMVAVALQLFVEGLMLHHNRQLCIGFGFVGMLLLGLSNALVK